MSYNTLDGYIASMSDQTRPDVLTKTTEETDTQFGFIWGVADDRYFLRTPDRQFRGVSEHVVETLREKATETSIDELIGDISEQRASAGAILREIHEEGFIREDAPVERLEPPEDIDLWPQLLLVATLISFAAGFWIHAISLLSEPAFDEPLGYLPETVVATAASLLVGTAIHEYGHHWAASRQGVQATLDFTVINGIVPAVVTRTNDSWALPRNRRMWVTFAGPVFGLGWTIGLFLLYHTLVAHPAVAIAALITFNAELSALIPVYHGDGYFVISDVLGRQDLRSRGLADLRDLRATWSAAYVVVSYGVVVGLFVANTVVLYLIGDYWGVLLSALFLLAALVIRLWRG